MAIKKLYCSCPDRKTIRRETAKTIFEDFEKYVLLFREEFQQEYLKTLKQKYLGDNE